MTRRLAGRLVLGGALSLALLTTCAGTAVSPGAALASTPLSSSSVVVDPPRRLGKPLVLIAMPDLEAFRTVRHALVAEIGRDFDVSTKLLDRHTSAAEFSATLERSGAACVVLMNNPTTSLYRAYQEGRRGHGAPIPAVVVMSSFLEDLRDELENATGVAYEVPGVTAFVSLRSVIKRPVQRVGVIHRPAFRRFIERQQALASQEQITLVPVAVPADASAADVSQALRQLGTMQIDALWVLNDNRLLGDAAFLDTAWRGEVATLGVPVVVGIPALVGVDVHFGTLAVLPDLDALGVQTANVLIDVADNGWLARAHRVELPLSTLTFVNMRQVRDQFGLREGAGERIDRKVE